MYKYSKIFMSNRETLLHTLQRLPQAGHFTQQHAEMWLGKLAEQTAADPQWSGLTMEQHVRRLGGFGASEIGVLVSERRGLYSPFDTAREVVARKLLLATSEPANEHMRRGLTMEPLIRREFLRRSGAVRREDLTRQVASHHPARWPWMQATPDDLVELDGVLGVVDYKAPAEPLTELSLSYACQFHQIGLLAQDLDLPLHWRSLIAWNHPRGCPEVFLCERDPHLEQEIIEAGEHYWHRHVLTGELPPWPSRPALALNLADLPLEAKAEIENLAARWLRFDVLAREAKALTEEARDRLLDGCRAYRLNDAVTSGPVQIKPKAVWNREAVEARLSAADRLPFLRYQWDTQALIELVRTLGGDPETARADDEPTLDLEAAARWLMTQKGIPETELRVTDYKSSVSRRKADQPLVEPVRDAARAATCQFSTLAPGA